VAFTPKNTIRAIAATRTIATNIEIIASADEELLCDICISPSKNFCIRNKNRFGLLKMNFITFILFVN